MNAPERRRLVAQAAIGLALCVGAYAALVRPAKERAARLRVEAQELGQRVAVAESVRDQMPVLTARLDQARRDAEEITRRSTPARNESDLFAAIASLANARGVQVDQLDPVAASAAPPAPGQAGPARDDRVLAYSITVRATYAQLAEFLGALESELGYTCVRRTRITPDPAGGTGAVIASIQTEHFAFDPSPVTLTPP